MMRKKKKKNIPQIAPLIWNIIFLTTSMILMVTLSKSYFILGVKETQVNEQESLHKSIFNKA
jgi:hypothetical protein